MRSKLYNEILKNTNPQRKKQLDRYWANYLKICGVKKRLLYHQYRPKYRRSITNDHTVVRYLAEVKDGIAGLCSIG